MFMRKLILFFTLLFLVILSYAQQKYKCTFRVTTTSGMSDSLFRFLAEKGTNLSPEAIEKFLEQGVYTDSWVSLNIVTAGKSQTIVTTIRYSVRGKDTIETRDSFLYKYDDIFYSAPSSTGFSAKPWDYPKKIFSATGKKNSIMNYQCDEYVSTDSTCTIWVSTELPEYINPGARTNNVNGAVLGFRIKRQQTDTKSIMVKLEKIL